MPILLHYSLRQPHERRLQVYLFRLDLANTELVGQQGDGDEAEIGRLLAQVRQPDRSLVAASQSVGAGTTSNSTTYAP